MFFPFSSTPSFLCDVPFLIPSSYADLTLFYPPLYMIGFSFLITSCGIIFPIPVLHFLVVFPCSLRHMLQSSTSLSFISQYPFLITSYATIFSFIPVFHFSVVSLYSIRHMLQSSPFLSFIFLLHYVICYNLLHSYLSFLSCVPLLNVICYNLLHSSLPFFSSVSFLITSNALIFSIPVFHF